MRTVLLLIAALAAVAVVNGQRRVAGSAFDGDQSGTDQDTLEVFGVTRPTTDSGSDDSSFSVTDRDSGSVTESRHRGHHHRKGGHGRGQFGSSSGDQGSDSDSSDTGFDRLTTQDPRFDSHGDLNGGSDRDVSDALGSMSSSGRVTRRRSSAGSFSGGSEGDRGSDFSSNSGQLTQFPANYRIEVEVQRLENKGSITATGSSCDILSACDTKLYAFIDTEKPLSAWPGSVPLAKWPVIFTVTNVDSPTISKVVTRDVCNGATVDQADLRVRAVDADSLSREDEINKFDCLFSLTPSSVGSDPSSAQWGDSMECKATSQVGKIKLFARQRAYQISSSNCNSQKF